MLEFLTANLATILLALAIAVIVVAIIAGMVRDRKRGVSSCGSACAGCPNAALCHGGKSVKDVHPKV